MYVQELLNVKVIYESKVTLVVSIGYGIYETSSHGSESTYDTIIPHGNNTGSILGESYCSAVKVVYHDTK